MRTIQTFAIVALACVGRFAHAEAPALEDLIAIVNGKDSVKSAEAVVAIGKLKPVSDQAIETLVDALADDRRAEKIPDYLPTLFQVRTVGSIAADVLVEIGKPAVSRICVLLEGHEDLVARRRAIYSLTKMRGDAAEALPTLERLLGDPEKQIREVAVAAVVAIQEDPRKLSSVLGPVLSDKSPDVRAAAIRAIGNLGGAGSQHVHRLLKLLDDTESRWIFYTADMAGKLPVRYDAAMALAETGNDGRIALARLREQMSGDSDPGVRVAAAFAVAKLDNAAKDAIEFLIAAVQDDEEEVYSPADAAVALGKIGPKAKAALRALNDALNHADTLVRISAVEAIVKISPETAEVRALKMLRDEEALVRASAIESLGSLQDPSPQLVNAIIAALDDSDDTLSEFVRYAAAVTLGNLRQKAVAALPRLKQVAQGDESERVRIAAAKSLQQISQGQPEGEKAKR